MGESNSPYFAQGCTDGDRDAARIGACPPEPPLGPDPERDWSWMYRRGYNAQFEAATPHTCGPGCAGESR